MSHESVTYQIGFSTLVVLAVLLWLAICAAAWWLGRTVRRHRSGIR